MQAMKGATQALGSMNKQMNLPQLQRIAMEFERENDIMEQRQDVMDESFEDAMDVGVEEEGDEVVDQVLEEIGVDFNQAVSATPPMRRWQCANLRLHSSAKHPQHWAILRNKRAVSHRPLAAMAVAVVAAAVLQTR